MWGEAVALALGYEPGRFIEAYRRNRGELSDEVLARDPVGSALLLLMEGRDSWEGTPIELHGVLQRIACKAKLDLTRFPRSPGPLSRRIDEIVPNLGEEGVTVSRPPRGKARKIRITRPRSVDDSDAISSTKQSGE